MNLPIATHRRSDETVTQDICPRGDYEIMIEVNGRHELPSYGTRFTRITAFLTRRRDNFEFGDLLNSFF